MDFRQPNELLSETIMTKDMDDLIDSRVSLKQCKKAVDALHSFTTKQQQKEEADQLLPGKEQYVWLNVNVKKISPTRKLKPTKIPIVHPLVDPRTSRVCLITKDPQREYKDLLEAQNIKFISRVVGLDKLKGKFKPFEARRALLKENGLFLADERIVPLLPKLLGSKWFEAKKQPIPVSLTRKDLKGELERAINSTYMNQNKGTCTSIKVGKVSQTVPQILANIQSAIPVVAKRIEGGWDNVQSLHIKTNSSVSLPIWSCTLDDSEGGRWHGIEAEEAVEASSDEAEVEEPKGKAGKATSKSRKRTSDADDESAEKPRKKAKAAKVDSGDKPAPISTQKSTRGKTVSDSTPHTSESSSPAKSSSKKNKTKSASVEGPSASDGKALSASGKSEGKKTQTAAKSSALKTSQPSTETLKKKPEAKSPLASSTSTAEPSLVKASGKPEAAVPDVKPRSTKKDKAAKAERDAPATAPSPTAAGKASSITKDELKQKRSAQPVEKKKMALSKGKPGKGAKNAVLGKKAGQD